MDDDDYILSFTIVISHIVHKRHNKRVGADTIIQNVQGDSGFIVGLPVTTSETGPGLG